ncbi:hypothetical protein D1BOALGB6SA_4506, partial [Olavius sp. associated proteobacterium Delta 1]
WIGRHYNGSDYHDGYMDELRYSKAARASAWRKATYHSLLGNLTEYSVGPDADGDGLSDFEEINTYGTDPNLADSDGDGIDDGDELSYWGVNWNVDYDSDGFNNLLDDDSDNDGVLDGEEIAKGFDPADPGSTPSAETSYITVTIDHFKIDADLVDFPVMLKLDESNALGFFNQIVSDPAS